MASEFYDDPELFANDLYFLKSDQPVTGALIKLVLEDLRRLYNQVGGSPLTTKGDIYIMDETLQNTRFPVDVDRTIIMNDSSSPLGRVNVNPVTEYDLMTDLQVLLNTVVVGSRKTINLTDGGGVTWTVTDNVGADRIEISATVATPSTPDLDAVLTAGNDGGAQEITNIADGTSATSAATVAQATKILTLGMTQGVIANTGLGETKLWSLLIPAPIIGNNDMLETFIANTRTGGSGNVQGRIYINTADTLVGAQLINTTFTGSNTMVSSTGYRKWLNSSTSTIGMATNATGPTITVGGTRLPLTINNAVDQYVIAAINQTVGTDTTNLEWVSVRLYKYP